MLYDTGKILITSNAVETGFPKGQFIQGNILLFACCVFYLAWWLTAFKPEGAVKGMKSGWLLLPAAVTGILAVVKIVTGIGRINMDSAAVSSAQICLIGIIAYAVLLTFTWLLMKRPATTELLLIVGWTTMVTAEVNALYTAHAFGQGQAAALLTASVVMALVSLVCYLVYYRLDAVKGYYDGMVPLVIVAVMTGIMLIVIFKDDQEEYTMETTDLSEDGQEEYAKEVDYYEKVIAAARESIGKIDETIPAEYGFSVAMKTGGYDEILGYLIEDIDGDGVDELIFGGNGTDPSLYDTWKSVIYDIYTISDGKLIHVLNGWNRNRYYFCESGMIANEGSSGADDSNYSYFTFDGSELHLVEAVIYDGMKDRDNPWFYSTESENDAGNAEPISEERAEEIRKKYVYEYPTFIPFIEG